MMALPSAAITSACNTVIQVNNLQAETIVDVTDSHLTECVCKHQTPLQTLA